MQGKKTVLKNKAGEIIFPVTHTSAIHYDDGQTVEQKEQVRNDNENTRISHESTRITSETGRVNAESQRVYNEDARKINETSRANNLNTAITNMNNTISTTMSSAITNANKTVSDSITVANTNINSTITNVNNNTLMTYKPSVVNYSDIATTYTSPQNGWVVQVTSTMERYRYNGSAWVNIGKYLDNTSIVVSATQPNNPSLNPIWFKQL